MIDTAASHARVFAADREPKLSMGMEPEMKRHVWNHQSSIFNAKQSGTASPAPPRAFHDLLESFFKTKATADRSGSVKTLLEDLKIFVTKHSLLEQTTKKDGEGSETPDSGVNPHASTEESAVLSCERMISRLTQLIETDKENDIYSGIWIAILSILAIEEQSSQGNGTGEASTASSSSPGGQEAPCPVFLQVGALLPFFQLHHPSEAEVKSEDSDNDFELNPKLLGYFTKAAAVYGERLELLEARRKKQEGLGSKVIQDTVDAKAEDTLATSSRDTTEGNQPEGGDEADQQSGSIEASNLPEQNGETETAEGENWDSRQESGSDDEDNNEAAGGVDESPAEEADPQSSDGSESSSSEGSSSSSSEEQNVEPQPEIPEAAAFVESERDISTDDDDDAILREALGISLARDEAEAEAVRVILADAVVPMEDDSLALHPSVETPVSEDASAGAANVVSEVESDPLYERSGSEGEEVSLPQMPSPTIPYPWRQPGTADTQTSDPDAVLEISPPMDPSNLSLFAAIPSSSALLHLLKYAESVMRRQDIIVGLTDSAFKTVTGGMGHELFSMKKDSRQESGRTNTPADRPFVFQLLISTVLSVAGKRGDAVEHLNHAMSREKVATRGGDVVMLGSGTADHSSASGEEQDDPALTFALNYVEDDVSLSVESLENKGMKRKAAAASHDAEALRQTLRKRTGAWKSRVELYSRCLLLALRCLTVLLQSATRAWLSTAGGGGQQDSLGTAVEGYSRFLPAEGLSKLVVVLDGLMASMDTGRSDVAEDTLLLREIYFASVAAWSECFPFLFSSAKGKLDLLHDLLGDTHDCSFESWNSLNSLPTSKKQGQLFKLRSLSRRIRVRDILESIIPSPMPCILEGLEGVSNTSPITELTALHLSTAITDRVTDPGDANSTENSHDSAGAVPLASALVMQLMDSELTRSDAELRKLFYALCHRMNAVTIMFDGLYAATETEAEKTSSMTSHKNKDGVGNGVVLNKTRSNNFVFDVTKCSDSIAILTGFDSPGGKGSTVLQRASKVWGTVHSSQFYNPKTGVHRWAVRLDKCERGHVFVGVATSRANVRTYVGGDKHGWGMIGTQALWHDRRKVSTCVQLILLRSIHLRLFISDSR